MATKKRVLKPKRHVTRVQWLKAPRVWRVRTVSQVGALGLAEPCHDATFFEKRAAVFWAAARSRIFWSNGRHAQLIICRKDGTIQDERTYGADPRRSKG